MKKKPIYSQLKEVVWCEQRRRWSMYGIYILKRGEMQCYGG